MEKYVLGIDNGGSVVKCAIFDTEGKEISSDSRRVPIYERRKGWVERDLEEMWQGTAAVIRGALKKAGLNGNEIAGVGITGYGNGICLVDQEGNGVYPAVISSDNRAVDLCERLVEEGVQDEIYELTYQEFWPAQTAVLMVWLKENEPEVLKKTATVLSAKDYLRMRLTGERCCELTETTCSGLMNIHDHTFDERIFEALGLSEYRDRMPALTGTTDISGYVTKEAARETGLSEGCVVAGSCYDINACALAGNVLEEGKLCMIAGTWSINEVLTKELIYGANSIACSFHPDYYIMEESSPTSTNNFEWFLSNFIDSGICGAKRKGTADQEETPDQKKTADRNALYEECNRAVERTSPEDSDIIFIPYLYASSTNPKAEGAFFNLKSSDRKNHLLRAVYEGILFSSMLHIKRLREAGCRFSEVRLSGGITKSEVWSQMACDMLQMPVEVIDASEPGALGAAMCAAIAAGMFEGFEDAAAAMVRMKKTYLPDPGRKDIYEKKYRRFEDALRALDFFCGGEGAI